MTERIVSSCIRSRHTRACQNVTTRATNSSLVYMTMLTGYSCMQLSHHQHHHHHHQFIHCRATYVLCSQHEYTIFGSRALGGAGRVPPSIVVFIFVSSFVSFLRDWWPTVIAVLHSHAWHIYSFHFVTSGIHFTFLDSAYTKYLFRHNHVLLSSFSWCFMFELWNVKFNTISGKAELPLLCTMEHNITVIKFNQYSTLAKIHPAYAAAFAVH